MSHDIYRPDFELDLPTPFKSADFWHAPKGALSSLNQVVSTIATSNVFFEFLHKKRK